MISLKQLTAKEYAQKTVDGNSKLDGFNLWEWTGRGSVVTLLAMYYSESATATLRIQMGSTGKLASTFFTGNSNSVEKVARSLASSWDMILPRS